MVIMTKQQVTARTSMMQWLVCWVELMIKSFKAFPSQSLVDGSHKVNWALYNSGHFYERNRIVSSTIIYKMSSLFPYMYYHAFSAVFLVLYFSALFNILYLIFICFVSDLCNSSPIILLITCVYFRYIIGL